MKYPFCSDGCGDKRGSNAERFTYAQGRIFRFTPGIFGVLDRHRGIDRRGITRVLNVQCR